MAVLCIRESVLRFIGMFGRQRYILSLVEEIKLNSISVAVLMDEIRVKSQKNLSIGSQQRVTDLDEILETALSGTE